MAVNVAGLIAIIIFYIIILVIGILAARKKKTGDEATGGEGEEIMLAGRNIGWFVGTFTMTATWVGGGYINGTAESVYTSGLVAAQAPWGYAVSLLIGGLFFAETMRERGYVTMLDPLQEKYSKWMGGILYIPAFLGETMWTAAILGALGATLSVILGMDIDLAVIISALIAVAYTFFGGLYAVAYTDVVQLICIFVGLWLTIPFAMTNYHVAKITTTSTSWIGTFDIKYTGQWMDYAMLLCFGGLPWQVYFQRVLSAKSSKYAKYSSIAASFGCLFMAVPAILIGAIAKSADWSGVAISGLKADNQTISDTRLVLPLVLQHLTPKWVSFFGLGAISAAVMSSADSSVLSASSMFSYNIYKLILRPKASDKELIWVIRIGIFGVGAVATVMALVIKSIYSLWALCSDLVFVILFPQLVCAIYVPFVNTYGSVCAFIVGLILRLGGGEELVGLSPFIKYPMYDAATHTQLFPFRTLAMVASFVTLLLVSYLTKLLFTKMLLSPKVDVLKVFHDQDKSDAEIVALNAQNQVDSPRGPEDTKL
eukprot:gene16197-17826_t